MLFLEELDYMRLYGARRKLYIPIDPSNRKKGAAVMLLTKNSVDSYSLMNMPYIYNPKLYESLYIDHNVNAYIDSGVIIDEDPDDETAVNEAIEEIPMHRKDIKVSVDCKTPSFNDLKLVKDVYNEKNFTKWYKFFHTLNRNICRDIKVEVYPNLATMAEYHQRDALKNNEVLKDSYSFDNIIIVVARSGYQPLEKKNGEYKQYLLNELIAFVCMKTSSKCDRFLANCIGTALSGQVSDRLDNEIQGDYLSTNNYALLTSYMIKRLYKEKGEKEVARLCKTGDYSILSLYATRRLIKNIKTFGEATLTAADRNSLSDSDYGLPSKKKYPMPDESHVRSAIRFFNHVDSEDEAELARNIKKKIKKFGMSVEVGEKNRFSKYYKESALLEEFDDESKNESAGVSYNPDGLYSDIMQIVDKLSGEERNRIALNGNYEDSPNVINRKIKRDENGNPIGFIDAYKFDSRPCEAQLVVALDPDHRGKGYMRNMVGDYINHPIDGYKDINRFVWFVDPANTSSVNLATHCGFKKTGARRYRDDLGIYEDMYEYNMPFRESTNKIPLPTRMIKESVHDNGYIVTDDYMMSEDFITFFNGMDNQIISEAEKKYDNRLKKYLFKERLKNNKSVIMRYQEMKAMCPWIKYTFVKLGAYRRRNVFIDLSYYHDIFMRNMGFKKDAAVKMYWDFLNRLLNESEYKTWYKKITIFMPVWPEAWDVKSADELMDYRQSINPISMIIRMLRKNPSELKKWGNKDFLFMSPSGYFRVNFSTFDLKNLAKFKRFITKLVNNDPIDDDETEDGYRATENQDSDSTAVITANIIDKLETNAGIKIDDMTGGVGNDFIPDDAEVIKPQLTFNHLRVRAEKIKLPSKYIERENKLKDKPKNSVLILAPDGDRAAEVFNQNQFDVSMFDKRGFYAP